MRGKIAKALRRITKFHPNTERLYQPLVRHLKVNTPDGERSREVLLRMTLDPKGTRKLYKNVKTRFKSLNVAEKTRARAYA